MNGFIQLINSKRIDLKYAIPISVLELRAFVMEARQGEVEELENEY